ncbi:kinase-like domain-containing protein [Xylaria intraflava]|nr:kinase-like domain-containing protein [Xylaria intraflava]
MGVIDFAARHGQVSLRCLFNRPLSLAFHTGTRMASTVVGNSGRVYVQGEVLQRRQDPMLSIFKAESQGESFVFKRVTRTLYNLALGVAAEFEGSRRLRLHVDCNHEQCVLVYPYFKTTLLTLIQEDPDFPPAERKRILQRVGEAIQELHSKDWIHIDVKPDNILVNWTCDEEGNKTVTGVALGDFDIAFKSVGGRPRETPYAIGNAMWRSPEGQTGSGVTKASDIFSFGLVCIFTFGGAELLLLGNYQELLKHGIKPEMEILIRHFSYFGLVPEGLLKQVNSEIWRDCLRGASRLAGHAVEDNPKLRFDYWGSGLDAEAKDMLSGMMNPDPTARTAIGQVMAHEWWLLYD